MLYRRVHTADRKDYVVEISRNKVKYFVVAVRLTRARRVQIIEYHRKQAEKLIRACGGVLALAQRIEFPYNTLAVKDANKILYDVPVGGGAN